MKRSQPTRRSLIAAGAALSAAALPSVAPAKAVTGEDALFRQWEAEADRLWAAASAKGITDDAADSLIDRYSVFEDLILTTPSAGRTAAQVKSRVLLRCLRGVGDARHGEALKAVLAALDGRAV